MELGIISWILLLLLFRIAYWYLSVPRNLPPGSAGLPIVGYLPYLGSYMHLILLKIGKKYGNIFHLYFGSRLVVVLNDYTSIHEAFVKNAEIFAGRPPDMNYRESEEDNLGIIATDGEFWKQHRRFILHNLRDYGVGKLALQPLLLNELQFCLEEIRKQNGKNFAIKELLSSSIANNIHILATGERYNYDHPTMKELFRLFKIVESGIPSVNLLMFFPWIAYIPGSERLVKRDFIRNLSNGFLKVVGDIIEKVKSEYKEGQQENYVQAYLTERAARLKADKNDKIFNELGLLHNTRDLIFAGTETSATTLHWALIYMTLNPTIQKKVQNEIDQVIGHEREPSYNDRTKMPFTEAVIMELHRHITLVPLSNPRRNFKDVTVLGYRIPKDTMIIPNLWAVHHDPKIWGDPENFRPERFLNENGQVKNSEYLIPFSVGKRACVGEPLARMEIFLYFVSLLQNFDFVPPEGEILNFDAHPGAARRPKSQVICAKQRVLD
ncbi:hypothetical protein CHUAL_007584 [Chamberlinius hualienensis]